MMPCLKKFVPLVLLLFVGCTIASQDPLIQSYKEQAARVEIIRDQWGIPHVYGKTDADAVFGLMYVQCEESFERVERNYIRKLGRMAEIEGSTRLYDDLQMKLLYDTTAAIADYKTSPPWLKTLLNAFAAGINYYLHRHPETRPQLLQHFEPWYALMMTDGAYLNNLDGGLTREDMRSLYGDNLRDAAQNIQTSPLTETEQRGSNGFALGPQKTLSGNSMLYINPHVTFDFRMEGHMVSEEGLNAYGAITWGQFFVFQGFNQHCGWMHTSSMADAADLYEESIVRESGQLFYTYDGRLKPVSEKPIRLKFKKEGMQERTFTTYYTHHGPVVGSRGSKWLALKQQNRTINGLIQSWQRTKATDLATFQRSMEIRANHSTNTLYADDKGNIAYWHGNFIPRRAKSYDWSRPVRGDTSATEWQGPHELKEIFHLLNPAGGWLQNCNSTPFTAAGFPSFPVDSLPPYMAPEGENFRSLQAIQAFSKEQKWSVDNLVSLGMSHYLPAFDSLLPPLLSDFKSLPQGDPFRVKLAEPMKELVSWDRHSSVTSVATTLAVLWGYVLLSDAETNMVASEKSSNQLALFSELVRSTPPRRRLEMLSQVLGILEKLFANWRIPWGEVNRYQKISGGVSHQFDDRQKSLAVGFGSALFGSLPSYETDWTNTRKAYGVAGNSFVAVVEFGKKLKARSIIPGGQSFVRDHKHFADQAELYVQGKFKDIFFYKEDVLKNKERSYHPGD
ncbi:MAG: penicillin acylase family protein [Bacteroidota bacterium]